MYKSVVENVQGDTWQYRTSLLDVEEASLNSTILNEKSQGKSNINVHLMSKVDYVLEELHTSNFDTISVPYFILQYST